MQKRSVFLLSVLCFGFAFLYVPILIMMAYSFNSSRLVTVWGGFSTEWYGKLLENDQVIDAALLSLQIAVVSASFATILGTFAGLALARLGRFKGRTLFSGMISAPLIMPDVITGLSLLLLFVSLESLIGWPAGRGCHDGNAGAHNLLDGVCGCHHSVPADGDGQFGRGSRPWTLVPRPCAYCGTSPCRSSHLPWCRDGCCRAPCRWMTW